MSIDKSTVFYKKALGSLIGGLIGDAMGTPTEGLSYLEIEQKFGWVEDFNSDGTDDTVMKNLLIQALVNTDGTATLDDWAEAWLDNWDQIFGDKVGRFFQSVLHTAAKLKRFSNPRMAALGNMPSSSSAMCISPVGIVNACNPRQAALQAYNIASLIHIHDVGFCQDAAAAMAAAVAEAFNPQATVDSIVEASTRHILKSSGEELLNLIDMATNLALEKKDYKSFRKAIYADEVHFNRKILCDSRETVPLTLALFMLADGDVEKSLVYSANFGRDADTIASMCAAIAGAFKGVDAFRPEWRKKAEQYSSQNQGDLAEKLVEIATKKVETEQQSQKIMKSLL